MYLKLIFIIVVVPLQYNVSYASFELITLLLF